MKGIIGIDFDNTIISYNELMYKVALQRGLISHDTQKVKRCIRDRIRHLPDGEKKWQALQAFVYGPGLKEAKLIEGVCTFCRVCHQHDVTVYIISHKTPYAACDETRTDLRQAAKLWMKKHRFFDDDGLQLSEDAVYFESTRNAKIDRIKKVGCTHFIDDLEETFLEDTFPVDVEKILYAPHGGHSALPKVTVLSTWRKILEHIDWPGS